MKTRARRESPKPSLCAPSRERDGRGVREERGAAANPGRDTEGREKDGRCAVVCPVLPCTQRSQQLTQSPEVRPRRTLLNLPVIGPDRIRTAKALADKAVKMRQIFSIQGPYPVVRAALRSRGWVERRLPRPHQQALHRHGDEADGDDADDSGEDVGDDGGDDHGSAKETDKGVDPEDVYDLMSRMVRNEMTYLYWTTYRDSVDTRLLRKEQMINHYTKAGSFTTKVGLCVNLRKLCWFDAADPDTFFPRCYRLGAEDEKHAFIEDFRRTACTSLLQCLLERSQGEWGEVEKRSTESCGQSRQVQGKPLKRRAVSAVPCRMIDSALRVCQDFLDSLEHNDIDVSLETPPTLTEQQWSEFLHNYYLVVHDGVEVEDSSRYINSCQAMLHKLQDVCPQLNTDGIHNIWIIKPGAMSRGRGIMCAKRLEDILKLVHSDPTLIKDSKWVVQKYLERPFLIHGTKFDLRQWFLVTDWNPLTIWFYKKCYLRFSTQPYTVQTLDSSVHLCNNSIQKNFQPSQQRHPNVPLDNMWSCGQFRAFLSNEGRAGQWGSMVVPGMKRAVIHALQTAQDLVESRRGSFELYGADFLLGEDLRPWLIEINASPTMAPSTAVTARLCAAVQEDTLRVVLDRRADRGAHTGGFQLIYKQAAVEVPQYVGINLLVEGSKIKLPRLPPRALNPGESRNNQSGLVVAKPRSLASINETKAEKPKAPAKRWLKTVVRQIRFEYRKAETPLLPACTPQGEVLGLQRQAQAWPQTFPCMRSNRPQSGRVRQVTETYRSLVLPLKIISLYDPDKHMPLEASNTHFPKSSVCFQNFSQHHQGRLILTSCSIQHAQKI